MIDWSAVIRTQAYLTTTNSEVAPLTTSSRTDTQLSRITSLATAKVAVIKPQVPRMTTTTAISTKERVWHHFRLDQTFMAISRLTKEWKTSMTNSNKINIIEVMVDSQPTTVQVRMTLTYRERTVVIWLAARTRDPTITWPSNNLLSNRLICSISVIRSKISAATKPKIVLEDMLQLRTWICTRDWSASRSSKTSSSRSISRTSLSWWIRKVQDKAHSLLGRRQAWLQRRTRWISMS